MARQDVFEHPGLQEEAEAPRAGVDRLRRKYAQRGADHRRGALRTFHRRDLRLAQLCIDSSHLQEHLVLNARGHSYDLVQAVRSDADAATALTSTKGDLRCGNPPHRSQALRTLADHRALEGRATGPADRSSIGVRLAALRASEHSGSSGCRCFFKAGSHPRGARMSGWLGGERGL